MVNNQKHIFLYKENNTVGSKSIIFTSSLTYNIISHLKSSVLPGFLLLSVNPKETITDVQKDLYTGYQRVIFNIEKRSTLKIQHDGIQELVK